MTKKISELSAEGSIAGTDALQISQSGVSRKVTKHQIIAGLASAAHQHDRADIADAGTLAALDTISPAEIDATVYARRPKLPPAPTTPRS
jgi:hypothetical protein